MIYNSNSNSNGLFGAYLVTEVFFWALYLFYLQPRANIRTKKAVPPRLRYTKDHQALFRRILFRLERTFESLNDKKNGRKLTKEEKEKEMRDFIAQFFRSWFYRVDGGDECLVKFTCLRKQQQCDENKEFSHRTYCSTSSLSCGGDAPPTSGTDVSDSDDNGGSEEEEEDDDEDEDEDDEDDDGRESYTKESNGTLVEPIRQDDLYDMLSWASFHKNNIDLEPWEQTQLKLTLEFLKTRYNIHLPNGRSNILRPHKISLEDVNALHRPLILYVIIHFIGFIGRIVLLLVGFRRFRSQSGLYYWYRPAKINTKELSNRQQQHQSSLLPLLFFHGLSPGGITFYLPLLLLCITPSLYPTTANKKNSRRPIFVFENRSISQFLTSAAMMTKALTEDETTSGVHEALCRHLPNANDGVALCGHSFGTFEMTWCIHHPILRSKIRQMILLNPVAIVLSEPDVLLSFIYKRLTFSGLFLFFKWDSFKAWMVRLVASSDLSTNRYLRRHFHWYLSELWLGDIPNHVNVLVCLSELDEISSATKVEHEIQLHNQIGKNRERRRNRDHYDDDDDDDGSHYSTLGPRRVHSICWKGSNHVRCMYDPKTWKQIRDFMRQHDHDDNDNE